jgi:predicted short-subunit dehydrogenase-like oxidoreductase (DUF2520 family)
MRENVGITIIGAGNLGTSLALALHRAGYSVEWIVARARGASLARARKLAKQVGARATAEFSSGIQSNLYWLCVPDRQISTVAASWAKRETWKGRVVFHSSGALTSDELVALRNRGATVASVHPLMTFVPRSRPSLVRVPFSIEGDTAAVRLAQRMVERMGGFSYSIRKSDKAAYHAWGTFASPLLTALLATTEQVAELAGVPAKVARGRMMPILLQTLANYASYGAPAAFSGPIIRGDVETIKRHLRVLRHKKVARDVYRALAESALQTLPNKNRRLLMRVLDSYR